MIDLYPYIVSVLCALIAGLSSYVCARRQAKAEITKLDRQFTIDLEKEREKAKLDLEKEREKNRLETERLQLQHQHELELKDKEMQNAMGESVVNTLFAELMKTPEMKQQISDSFKKGGKKK
ncbi:MAG: hypothetical protein IJ639_03220 [Ruminococcus sp.]|nr:hypothetical protein [Ruminococcus sp.]